jgi:hypothetical protein
MQKVHLLIIVVQVDCYQYAQNLTGTTNEQTYRYSYRRR